MKLRTPCWTKNGAAKCSWKSERHILIAMYYIETVMKPYCEVGHVCVTRLHSEPLCTYSLSNIILKKYGGDLRILYSNGLLHAEGVVGTNLGEFP